MKSDDIKIHIKTTADTAGADKADKAINELKDSIFAVENAAVGAQRELDVLAARDRATARGKKADGGLLDTDITGGLGALANKAGFGAQFDAVSKIISAPAAAVVAKVALVGVAAAKAYQALTGTVAGYKQLMKEAAAEGESLGADIEEQIRLLEGTLGPLASTIDWVGEKWKGLVKAFQNPIDTFSGLGDLRRSMEQAREQMEKLNALRLQIASASQTGLTAVYDQELSALKDQEATIKRIAALRNELASLEVGGARQEVESARLRGGDVELAEANLLAAELKISLSKLGDNLTASQRDAETARTQLDSAMVKYQDAIRTNLNKLDPAEFAKLSTAVDSAQKSYADANQAVSDQSQIFAETKTNILRGAENALAKLDTDTQGAISKAAELKRAGIYDAIKNELAGIDTAPVVAAINQKSQQIAEGLGKIDSSVAAVTSTAQEVTNAVQTAAAGSTQAVQDIGTAAAANAAALDQAVGAAGKKVNEAIDRMADSVITALTQITAITISHAAKLSSQQSQINSLHSRHR